MFTEWFLHKDGSQYGPYTWEQLCAFAREGRVQPGDTVWNGEIVKWTPAREVHGLLSQETVEEQKEEGTPHPLSGGDGEDLLGIIPALNKQVGILKSKMYTLVVTNRRLIFAELTNKMLQAAASEANEQSKGKGIFSRMKDVYTSPQRVYSRYQNMAVEEILRETPGNFAVNNNEVKAVRISHVRIPRGHYINERGNRDKGSMLIRTTREKIKLTFQYNNSADAKKSLWRALGNIVK